MQGTGKKKMKKKIIYGILIVIIIAGIAIVATQGLRADIIYSKNVKIDIYLGKEFKNNDIKQMAQEVFGYDRILIQKVELYGDMVSITIPDKNDDNLDEKVEQLNSKINEKYELENTVDEDITVTYQPKIKLSSIFMPYVWPLAISALIILVYVIVRYRKIGIIRTIAFYAVTILASEAVYLSILAIARVPVNRLTMPIGLLIYVIVLTIVTAIKEKQYARFKETLKNNKKVESKE